MKPTSENGLGQDSVCLETCSLGQLFSNPLVIPDYQRNYCWEDKQVKGLLYDLKRHFDKHQDDSPYYLGMLSCIKSNSHYDLIDGQQRFTVMMLMAIVLKEYHSDGWNKFLDNAKRLEFVARTKDNEYLKAKVNGASVAPALNYNMEAGIKQISDFMNNPEIFSSDNARAAFDVCEKSYDLMDEKTIGQIDAEQQNFNQYKIETGDRSLISFSEYLMLVIDLYLHLKGSYSFYREELLTVFSDNHRTILYKA